MKPRTLAIILLLSLWNICPELAEAHSMYQSAVLLDLRSQSVDAELQLPVDRLSISFRQTVDAQHLSAERNLLSSYVRAHVRPITEENRPFAVDVVSMKIVTIENAPYLVVRLALTPPAGGTVDRFTLNYDVITHEIVTHAVLVSIRSDVRAEIQPTDPTLIGLIRGERKSVTVDRAKQITRQAK